ncbi:MAG: hypothetical protein ACRDBQ_11970 [Shewanella sp.]
MKQYLKMGDEFTSEVRCEDGMLVTDGTYYADIHSDGDLICHAINSHDELVEMNKELLAALELAREYLNHPGGASGSAWFKLNDMVISVITKAKGGAA